METIELNARIYLTAHQLGYVKYLNEERSRRCASGILAVSVAGSAWRSVSIVPSPVTMFRQVGFCDGLSRAAFSGWAAVALFVTCLVDYSSVHRIARCACWSISA